MARRQFLSTKAIQEMLENWSDDEEVENVVLFPPEKVDALTDEEDFDDEAVPAFDSDTIPEVTGTVDIEYSSRKEDFAAPQDTITPISVCSTEMQQQDLQEIEK